MEEVSFNSHGTGFVLVNGQTVILQKGSTVGNIGEINEEIFQSALNEVNQSNSSKDITHLHDALTATSNINNFTESSYVIVGDEEKSNSKMIRLTLDQASELGFEFSLRDETVKEIKQEQDRQNILGSEYFYQDPVHQASEICEVDDNNVEGSLDLNNYNDLLQLPTTSDSLNPQITLVPQFIDGNLTYTLQFGESLNNFEFAQTAIVENSSNLTIPTLSLSTQQASVDKTETNTKHIPVAAGVAVRSPAVEVNLVDKAVPNNIASCRPENPLSVGVKSMKKEHENMYPVLNKALGSNNKPRILANVKSVQHNTVTNLQKIANPSKKPHSKISGATKGQSLLISNQRKLVPMKMPLPSLNSTNDKAGVVISTAKKPVFYKTFNSIKPIDTGNGIIKRQLVTVSKKTKSITKLDESSLNPKVPSISCIDQIAMNNSNNEAVQKCVSNNGLSCQKTVDENVNGVKPARRLTQSQLKQIASVIQKNRNNQSGFSSPSTLYDTETNTRIICRSGRLSRPPRHMVKDYKRLQGDDIDGVYSDYVSEDEDNSENTAAVNLLPGSGPEGGNNLKNTNLCRRGLGWGRGRGKFKRLHSDFSLKELNDDVLSNVFGIAKGSYTINDFGLDDVSFNLKESPKMDDAESDIKRCKVENLQDNTSELLEENRCETSFLLNSEILCDKTFSAVDKAGIDSVDQIVNERLKTLTPVDDIMPSLTALRDANRSLDSSDDLMAGLLTPVESISTQSLADSIMFTSQNESRLACRTAVSASTEDLMKSLENLSREINGGVSDNGTTDIDFSVLSQDFASGR
ncbi:hypothetical protein AAG570_008482 [Ranatra chinensis]|uniref:Uncharacterized protein n=1 Tax=Ranatra chinensis TaxID=642074 RepID=A0ABD0Z842_9HEMI